MYGGYYGELEVNGDPVDPLANKDLFDLASVGLAYGMYFNVTRDPAAEADLLAVRDLIFDKYYDAATEPDEGLPRTMTSPRRWTRAATAETSPTSSCRAPHVSLPNAALLSDPARRAQFESDLRLLTEILIARHKNTAANPANRFWFWGRTGRFGTFNAAQTDFGHNIKSYEMIYNANQRVRRPSVGRPRPRTARTCSTRAWDDTASRWNQDLRNFVPGNVEPDSGWWIHDEADQTLAALDLAKGFAHTDQLARSAQTFLDVYVDRDPAYPARETFSRVERDWARDRPAQVVLRQEHAPQPRARADHVPARPALEGLPAKLHYAFPEDQALTAVAKPYWFDAAGESRTVTGDVDHAPRAQGRRSRVHRHRQLPHPSPTRRPTTPRAPTTTRGRVSAAPTRRMAQRRRSPSP